MAFDGDSTPGDWPTNHTMNDSSDYPPRDLNPYDAYPDAPGPEHTAWPTNNRMNDDPSYPPRDLNPLEVYSDNGTV